MAVHSHTSLTAYNNRMYFLTCTFAETDITSFSDSEFVSKSSLFDHVFVNCHKRLQLLMLLNGELFK